MTDVVGVNLTQELASRAQGRDPAWEIQSPKNATAALPSVGDPADFGGAPEKAAGFGVSVQKAIVTMWTVGLREDPAQHRSRVRIDTLDLSATYTVTIDGNAVAHDAGAAGDTSEAEVLQGLADAINADGTVGAIVNASTEARNSATADTIVLANLTGEDLTHQTAVSATGSAVLEFDEDATAADARIWILPDADNDDLKLDLAWAKVLDGEVAGLDRRNIVERFETSGSKRMYIELTSVESPTLGAKVQVVVAIGPGSRETT